jgi:hypothetical protein
MSVTRGLAAAGAGIGLAIALGACGNKDPRLSVEQTFTPADMCGALVDAMDATQDSVVVDGVTISLGSFAIKEQSVSYDGAPPVVEQMASGYYEPSDSYRRIPAIGEVVCILNTPLAGGVDLDARIKLSEMNESGDDPDAQFVLDPEDVVAIPPNGWRGPDLLISHEPLADALCGAGSVPVMDLNNSGHSSDAYRHNAAVSGYPDSQLGCADASNIQWAQD